MTSFKFDHIKNPGKTVDETFFSSESHLSMYDESCIKWVLRLNYHLKALLMCIGYYAGSFC